MTLSFTAALLACSKPGGTPIDHTGHAGAPPSPHAGHAASAPSGYAAFEIGPDAGYIQVATEKVEEREFDRILRTTGVVAADETRTAHVHTKVRGFIQGVSVNFIGQKVRSGEALCGLYSQEVLSAELEFLAILDRSSAPVPEGEFAASERAAQKQLLDAARRRLSLWDVPKAEIDRLEKTRDARKTFSLHAPRGGVVVAKQAIDGMFVDSSLELYTISDLSRVWVLVDVYEADVPYVHIGEQADLTIEGVEAPVQAKVTFLPPTVDEATRTLKVRFELDNKSGAYRPGAFAAATLDAKIGKALAVPESAVVRTGTRSLVFVVHGGTHVVPREITLGPLVGDHYQVRSGVAAGEDVAISAQFLLDSESRIRATSADAPHSGHAH